MKYKDLNAFKLKKHDRASIAGIYILWWENELVYVGQSANIFHRMQEHRQKKWDSFNYIKIPFLLDRLKVETFLIAKYKPKYNKETIKNPELVIAKFIKLFGEELVKEK